MIVPRSTPISAGWLEYVQLRLDAAAVTGQKLRSGFGRAGREIGVIEMLGPGAQITTVAAGFYHGGSAPPLD